MMAASFLIRGDQDGANDGVFAQTWESNKVGDEFQINTNFYQSSELPEDALLMENGDILVSYRENADYYGGQYSDVVLGKIPSGHYEIENEIFANQFTDGNQEDQRLAKLNNGNGDIVVIWWSDKDLDGSRGGIIGRIFDKDLNPKGSEFVVNNYRNGDQFNRM